MKRIEGPQTPFEVYCAHCKVTFPIGTRQCLHCGGRVISPDRQRATRPSGRARLAKAAQKRLQASTTTGREERGRNPTLEELAGAGIPGAIPGPALPNDDVDEILPTRRFSPMTTIWILLAFTGAAIRACGGG